MRAMILSAGLGTRLRPITNTIPKPLLRVGDRSLIEHHLANLKNAGIIDVVINTHYLADLIPKALGDGNKYGMNIGYSHEPECLGTGGGIKKALSSFLPNDNDPIIICNADTLINIDLAKLIKAHQYHKENFNAVASLVLLNSPESSFYGEIGVNYEGEIVNFVNRAIKYSDTSSTNSTNNSELKSTTLSRNNGDVVKTGLFTGIHIIEPEVLNWIPNITPCCINQAVYPNLMKNGAKIFSFFNTSYWSDVGTPQRYYLANKSWLLGDVDGIHKGKYISKSAVLGKNVKLEGNIIIGDTTFIGDNTVLSNTVVLENSVIKTNSIIKNAIIYRANNNTFAITMDE